MKKQSIITALAVSSLVLGTGVAFAEDIVIGDNTVIETPLPSDNVVIGNDETSLPDIPNQPVPEVSEQPSTVIGSDEATVPVENKDTVASTEEVVPEEPVKPSEDVKLGDDEADKDILKEPLDNKKEEQLKPKEGSDNKSDGDNNVLPVVTEELKEAEKNTGASSTGAAKPVTRPEFITPVVTDKGHTIVGTQGGDVIIQTPEGSTEVKKAENIGAVRQSDGTVAVKTQSGKLEVLPATGEGDTIYMVVMGFFFALRALLFHRKEQLKNWLKSFKK